MTRHKQSHRIKRHDMTRHDTSQLTSSTHHGTWQPTTLLHLAPQTTSWHQSRSHHHHVTAEGQQKQRNGRFGHCAGRSPCAHSIGKFFLCYISSFPFGNFRPRLARLYLYIEYIALNCFWDIFWTWKCWMHGTHFGVLQLLGAFVSDADHRRATSGWRRAAGTKGQIPQFISRDHTTERNRRAQVGPLSAKDAAARNSTKQHLFAFSQILKHSVWVLPIAFVWTWFCQIVAVGLTSWFCCDACKLGFCLLCSRVWCFNWPGSTQCPSELACLGLSQVVPTGCHELRSLPEYLLNFALYSRFLIKRDPERSPSAVVPLRPCWRVLGPLLIG